MLIRFLIFVSGALFIDSAFAQNSFDALVEKALQKNAEYSAFLKDKEAAQSRASGSHSTFYPSLNAVGGWENRREDIEPAKGYLGYLRGQMNLFNGFKDRALVRKAGSDLTVQEANLEIKKRDVRLSVKEAVSEMLYLHGLREIFKEEINLAQIQKQMATKKIAAGLTSSVDNIEFELRQDELEIQKRRIEQTHLEVHQKLFRIFGEELQDQEFEKIQFRTAPEIKMILQSAKIENNPLLRKAQGDIEASEAEKVTARSEFIPRLDFEYAFGRITPSEVAPLRYDETRVGIFLTIPLFSGFDSYYKVRAANLNFAAKDKEKTQAALNLQSEFEILKEKIKESLDLLEINQRKRVSAKKYFDMTLGEYKRGIKNSPDLVGATERFFEAEKQSYEIQKDLEILSTKLENLI